MATFAKTIALRSVGRKDSPVDSQLLTGVIAGVVALIVSLVTWTMARHKDQGDRMRQERELQRKLTEKLYALRVRHYPRAFSITQGLLGNVVLTSDVARDEVETVRRDLANWLASEASFILSQRSIDAYYLIRDALDVEPREAGRYSQSQREAMWRAKNQFRRCLRDDVHLLFTEDRPLDRPQAAGSVLPREVSGKPVADLPASASQVGARQHRA